MGSSGRGTSPAASKMIHGVVQPSGAPQNAKHGAKKTMKEIQFDIIMAAMEPSLILTLEDLSIDDREGE